MITLSAKNCLVIDRQGRRLTCDFDVIVRRLIDCFTACGVRDTSIAEHIALVVEEKLRTENAAGNAVRETAIDGLILSILNAAGYSEVASEYRTARCMPGDAVPVPVTAPWTRDRIRKLAAARMPGLADSEGAIAAVEAMLARVGLPDVSDGLILELLQHIAVRKTEAAGDVAESAAKVDRLWLMSPADWNAVQAATKPSLYDNHVLRLHPVSAVLPRVRLSFDCLNFAEWLGAVPMTEMLFLSGLHSVGPDIATSLRMARERVTELRGDAGSHPAHLLVRHFDRCLEEVFVPLSLRDVEELTADVLRLLEHDITGCLDFPVLLTSR